MARRSFTSESVTEGHPDKMCDQVSDAILDAILAADRRCRVACETVVKTGLVHVVGEIATVAHVDIPRIVRRTLRELGYDSFAAGFDADSCAVLVTVEDRRRRRALGVADPGTVFGFACAETPTFMPLPITLAHQLCRRLALVRRRDPGGVLRPGGTSQVTVDYDGHTPGRVAAVAVSAPHRAGVSRRALVELVMDEIIGPTIPAALRDHATAVHVSSTGGFDPGLTGRRIMDDTYGGVGRHGGGAFSGKDPSHVARSAAYYARFVAKHLVAARLAERVEVQLAYAAGIARPVSVSVDSFGTARVGDARLAELVRAHFDARPARMIAELDLLRPIYAATAAYGHFGREDPDFTWERLPKLDALRRES